MNNAANLAKSANATNTADFANAANAINAATSCPPAARYVTDFMVRKVAVGSFNLRSLVTLCLIAPCCFLIVVYDYCSYLLLTLDTTHFNFRLLDREGSVHPH